MNLVIGATGILGSHVVLKLLQNNEEVIAGKQKTSDIKKVEKLFSYYTTNAKQLFEKIKWVDVDVSDIYSIEEALEGVSIVYNCSGFVSFNKKDYSKIAKYCQKDVITLARVYNRFMGLGNLPDDDIIFA